MPEITFRVCPSQICKYPECLLPGSVSAQIGVKHDPDKTGTVQRSLVVMGQRGLLWKTVDAGTLSKSQGPFQLNLQVCNSRDELLIHS